MGVGTDTDKDLRCLWESVCAEVSPRAGEDMLAAVSKGMGTDLLATKVDKRVARLRALGNAVVPQVVPPFLAFGIYHWDINVRISTIVGFVGGGGIGFVLYEWMKVTQWRAAAVAILAIIIVVTMMDTISARVRARLV